ncbi:hypothetical protein [Aestuariivirga sp.]|uniref:hypothetical protein n=1 Tax=Aestuariivirga sp. TaxID=2650926 RepID=UPI003BAB3063
MISRRALIMLAACCLSSEAQADDGSALAQRIFQVIDALDVEDNWPAGVHVDWQTGVPDGRYVAPGHKDTHCSAFVAAAAEHLGVYILRPPEHGQVLLANAQADWLAGEGAAQGWTALPDMYAAQAAANAGQLVVASYKNPDDDRPGHIAIVRPSQKSQDQITSDGPDITQAGLKNFFHTTVRAGFADHRNAFAGNGILYYAHAVDPAALPA